MALNIGICWDNKRANTYNPQNERILTNTLMLRMKVILEHIDFLSNGFKMRIMVQIVHLQILVEAHKFTWHLQSNH